MVAYSDEAKRAAKDEKFYLFKFELDGRGVPTELINGEVAGGSKMELSTAITRRQYRAFMRFYLTHLCGGDKGKADHKKYVERLTAKQEKQKVTVKRRK
jgi:hypothetical protein